MQDDATSFDARQRSILEAIALGMPLLQVLGQIVHLIEAQAAGMLCAIMLIDQRGCIRHAAAPHIPIDFIRAIDGQQIGPAAGSCGTAAYTGKPVIVDDISTSVLWKDYRHLALPLGLRACWSTPILAPDGAVAGTFAMYYREVRTPAPQELEWTRAATHLASIAIRSDRARQIEAERRSMEEAMRLGELLRSVILDSVDQAIFYLANESPGVYRFLWVNGAFTRLFGTPESGMVGRALHEALHDHNRVRVLARYATAAATGERQIWEETFTARGSEVQIEVTVVPVIDASGHCTNFVVTLHDLTARINAERERAQLQAQLHHAQRMQALGTLAGGIAHDFNNILAAIGGNTHLVLDDLPTTSSFRPYLLEIRNASRRASDLVRQILAFSRSATPVVEVVDPRTVASEAVALLRAMLPPKIDIATCFADNVPHVRADSTQLHQVIVNLVTNAAHALGMGGTVEVVLAGMTTQEPASASSAVPPGRYLQLRVIDHGSGMDAATIKRAFDPFFTTRAPGEGAGLGLSVVHGIVESHGGAVDIASEQGRGTTVSVYLPATDEPVTIAESRLQEPGHGERVMYVDDEEALVFLMDRALTKLGYRITAHNDPAMALRDFAAHAREFDVVITDLAMPGLSGSELAAELRKIRADIPIIITSGYIRSEDVEMAERLRINRLVYKSSTIDRLCEALAAEIAALRDDSERAGQPMVDSSE